MSVTMTAKQLDLTRGLCKDSFQDFVKTFWHTVIPEKLVWNWHLPLLADEMQGPAERVFAGLPMVEDLLINVPPGSSKSTIASVMFPAWTWTRMPSARTIGASYAYPLALELSRKSRDVVNSDLYRAMFPQVKLRGDQDTKGYFVNNSGGGRYAVGSGGSVTGMHGHFIVIDDPIDPNKATSESEMASTNHWLSQTLSSRKVDRTLSVTYLVMQRLHQDDPAARMLERGRVRHLKIPADDSYDIQPPGLKKFYVNGLMDPVRLPRQVLKDAEKEMGPYGFAGQYGQDPVPAGGGEFLVDKFGTLDFLPTNVRTVRFWDKAATRGGGAFSVGVKLCLLDDGRVGVLDVVRVQYDWHAREVLIKQVAVNDGPKVLVGVEQEPGSGGKESAELTVKSLHGYRVQVVKPTGDKALRAAPFGAQVNAGNVLLRPGPWNRDFVQELRFFPNGKFKDQVDAASAAYSLLVKGRVKIGGMRGKP